MIYLRTLLLLLLLANRGAHSIQRSLKGIYVLCLSNGPASPNVSSLNDSLHANCSIISASSDISTNKSLLITSVNVNATSTTIVDNGNDGDDDDNDEDDDQVMDGLITGSYTSSATVRNVTGKEQHGPEISIERNDTSSSSGNVTIATNVSTIPSTVDTLMSDIEISKPQSRSFQKYLNYMARRGNQSFERQPHMALSFVNGIYHTEDDWKNISDGLNEMFGIRVKAFYNPSSGWWVSDATKAGLELALKRNDVATAKLLTEHLRAVLRDLGPRGRVLHLAHSGGAILTYLAAKHHLTAEEKGRIDVATFGGGKSITRKYFRGRTVNYYSRNDPLLLLDQRAARLSKLALSGTLFAEVKDIKHNTTFVYLSPLGNNPLIDHSMGGPTYQWALHMEAVNFKARLIELLARDEMERDSIRLLRKRVAALTGVHNFWEGPSLLVRRVRKVSARITKKRGYFSKKYLTFSNSSNCSIVISNQNETMVGIKSSSNSLLNGRATDKIQQIIIYNNTSEEREASLAAKFYNSALVNLKMVRERIENYTRTYWKDRIYIDTITLSSVNISSISASFKTFQIRRAKRRSKNWLL